MPLYVSFFSLFPFCFSLIFSVVGFLRFILRNFSLNSPCWGMLGPYLPSLINCNLMPLPHIYRVGPLPKFLWENIEVGAGSYFGYTTEEENHISPHMFSRSISVRHDLKVILYYAMLRHHFKSPSSLVRELSTLFTIQYSNTSKLFLQKFIVLSPKNPPVKQEGFWQDF